MNNHDVPKKLTFSIILLIILSLCLCVTTFALTYSILSVENNLFKSGYVSINLNDGNPIIKENEFAFEPCMTVKKDFFIKNNSSWSVYYKLYFDNVEGELADDLMISILAGEDELYSGTAKTLNSSVGAADDILKIGETRWLTVIFHFPSNIGNISKNQVLTFDLRADAVQTKNNPEKSFN